MSVRVDVWSDVVCPWCYIGKRKLELGIEEFSREIPGAVTVTFHSFELSPDTPVGFEGTTVDYLTKHRGLSQDQVRAMMDRVTATATEVGLPIDVYGAIQTNTVLAHQLLHHAKAAGLQSAVKDRLFAAHFVEARNVGDIPTLVEIAVDAGLDAEETAAVLADERHLADVRADQDRARSLGISGVPFFVFEDRLAVSGAHDPATFARALREASKPEA